MEQDSLFTKDILKRLSKSNLYQYLKHDIVPMRPSDQKIFAEVSPTHWLFIKCVSIHSKRIQIRIYPSNEDGLSCWDKPYLVLPSLGTYRTMLWNAMFKGIS